jgi:hypothetical protein
MRTTIEMKPEHRARIVELANARGDRGFSAVVGEALEMYLQAHIGRRDEIQKAFGLAASLVSSSECFRKRERRTISLISMRIFRMKLQFFRFIRWK